MTSQQAKALCQLLHIQMGKNSYAFYATAALFGHDLFQSTSQLEQIAWSDTDDAYSMEIKRKLTKNASAMFRDMADALDEKK